MQFIFLSLFTSTAILVDLVKSHENCAGCAASVGSSVPLSGWVPHTRKVLFINFVYRTGQMCRAVGTCVRTLAVMRMC